MQNALGYHGDKGLLSSLMGWIVAGNITPSFIEGNALTDEVSVLCCIFALLIKTLIANLQSKIMHVFKKLIY